MSFIDNSQTSYLHYFWPTLDNIHAYTTTRLGGFSKAPYASFNLAQHVGDDPAAVCLNREKLHNDLGLPAAPIWLKQVHSSRAICLDDRVSTRSLEADASFTTKTNIVCAILTADCLPILLANKKGTLVAAIHAGWQGLAAGIIESTIESMRQRISLPSEEIIVWFGPAIGPTAFRVKNDVRQNFLQGDIEAANCFQRQDDDTWLTDIYALARLRLNRYGINDVFSGEFCTYNDSERFFSYRRDDGVTGRMATLIWRSSAE